MRISRSDNGPWLPLSAHSEFLDLVAHLTRGAEAVEMESEIQNTVAKLHAGAPLRQRERNWRLAIAAGAIAIVILAAILWLIAR
jgi:hypothetical protein